MLDNSGLSVASPSPFGTALKNVHLTVARGEILGIGGVAGNGQDELLNALSGETLVSPGMLNFDGRDIGLLGPIARRALGVLAAPEERLGHAAVPDMSLTENAMLTGAAREGLERGGMLDWGKAR